MSYVLWFLTFNYTIMCAWVFLILNITLRQSWFTYLFFYCHLYWWIEHTIHGISKLLFLTFWDFELLFFIKKVWRFKKGKTLVISMWSAAHQHSALLSVDVLPVNWSTTISHPVTYEVLLQGFFFLLFKF